MEVSHSTVLALRSNPPSVDVIGLWAFARLSDMIFGTFRTLVIFFVAALVGGATSLYFNHPLVTMAVGASSGLFGLLGAWLFYKIASPLGEAWAWKAVLIPIGVNLAIPYFVPIVDNWAHLGGLIGGFVAAACLGLKDDPEVGLVNSSGTKLVHALLSLALAVGCFLLLTGRAPIPWHGKTFLEGVQALQAGNEVEAEAKIRETYRRWDSHWSSHYYLAQALEAQNKITEANTVAQRAQELRSHTNLVVKTLEWVHSHVSKVVDP